MPPPFLLLVSLVLLVLLAAVSDCGMVLLELELDELGLVELGLVALGLLGFAVDGWSACGCVLWLLGLLGVAEGCC